MANAENKVPFQANDGNQQFTGFFSNNKSTDFVLKVMFVLLQFLLILILTAWYITRKNIRFPCASVMKVQPKTPFLKDFLKEFTDPFVLVEFNRKRERLFVISEPEMIYSSCFISKLIFARPHLAFDDWKVTTVFSLNYEEMRIVSLVSRFAVDDLLHAETLFTDSLEECLSESCEQLVSAGGGEITYELMLDIVQSYFKESVFGYSHLCDDLQPQLDDILLKYLAFFKSSHLLNSNCDKAALQRMQQKLHTDIREFLDHFISDTHSSLADKAVSFAEKFIKEKASFDLCGISDTEFVTANHMLQESLDFASLALTLLPDLLFATLHRIAQSPKEFFDIVDVADNLCVEAALEEIIRTEDIGADVCQFYTTVEFVCKEQQLPTGSFVSLNLATVNRDPRLFPQPLEFRWRRFFAEADAEGKGEAAAEAAAAAGGEVWTASVSPLRSIYAKNSFFGFCLSFASACVQQLLHRFRFELAPAAEGAAAAPRLLCCTRRR